MARVDRKRDSLPEEMRDEKNQLVRGRDKLRVWTEAFRKLGSEENTNSFDPDHKDVVERQLKLIEEKEGHRERSRLAEEYNRPLEQKEIACAIKKLQRNKAAGLDGMINEIFMYGGKELENATFKFFKEIWDSEVFPQEWSKGLIFPL